MFQILGAAVLHSSEENLEHWKYFWNVYCVLTNHMRDLVTAENKWVSHARNRVGSPFVLKDLHLNLQEFKLLFLFIWEPHTLREQKMCEWSLACCGCIVATTADCQKQRSLFFNSLTVDEFENMSFSKCATARYMMQARLEGTDDSA